MTTDIECEFGCECDKGNTFDPADAVLGVKDFERLVIEKIERARSYINTRDQNIQFEND